MPDRCSTIAAGTRNSNGERVTPASRHPTPERLDDPRTDRRTAVASGEDIARCNRWLGGLHALRAQFRPLWAQLPARCTVLDVACGVGDLGAALIRDGARRGVEVRVIALDRRHELAERAGARGSLPLVADVAALPLAPASVDVAICGQFLHHLDATGIVRLVTDLGRLARHAVLISDLRRSRAATLGLWVASWPLALHPISRHDGMASVRNGFSAPELAALLSDAAGHPVRVVPRFPFRLTATWTPHPL